ncbi:MAG: non-ribosomal peptide synthetase [Syntrophales bacterium]
MSLLGPSMESPDPSENPVTEQFSEWIELKPEMVELMERQMEYWKVRLLDYWKIRLSDASILELPIDKTRPAVQSYRGESLQFVLSPGLTEELKTLSRREGVTLFMILVAAFQVLLHRYSGQDDIVIGTPTTGQNYLKLEKSIGFFVNLLALRTNLSGNPGFRELLKQVREVTIEAYANQNMPLEKLVEALHLQRDLSRNPLFQVMFVFQNTPDDKLQLDEIPTEFLKVNTETTQFDLTLELTEFSHGLIGRVGYATDLFEDATISRLIGHFQTLLEGITAHPDARLSELPLLTESERLQLLVEWNNTAASFPQDKCIHELFEAQVAATPQAVAVVHGNSQLTYAELNSQANQLAHYLRELGVKPDTLVAICIERSLNMVVGLLAILKAGGAYVPLDPAYPKERLAFMLEDSAPQALLTQGQLENLFTGMVKTLPIIDLGAEYLPWASRPDTNPDRHEQELTPNHLVYVVYTSGSTGKPKGVMIEHKGLCNMITDAKKRYEICEKDRVLQFLSIAFDAFAQEFFGALLSGASLVLRSDDWLCGARKFWELCEKNNVSIVTLPALFWRQLAQEDQVAIPVTIRQIIIGGEAVSSKALTSWFERGSYCPKLFNAYGPTETTINATIHQTSVDSLSLPSIGRPIANTSIYILDANNQPVPIGVTGEIYIGGAGVARGYLHRPELTAERFVVDPFATETEVRMYKTGDLARWLTDGTIEFLGRNDFQVKIRGFRVELGDIEAELVGHPAVRDVVVLAQENGDEARRLVAYLVLEDNFTPNVSELRDFLKNKMPEFMMPSIFVFLNALPITPNGKLDRKALPDSLDESAVVTDSAPRNEIERKLADIWKDLLGLKNIGIQDNFFNVGGYSLLAVKLITEVNNLFHVDLPIGAIYQSPTIKELGIIISSDNKQPSLYSLVPIQTQGSRPPLFAIHTITLLDLPRHLGKDQPLYFLRYGMGAEIKHSVSLPLLEELAYHYIKEMQQVQPHGPYYLIGFSFGGVIAYEMANQLVANGHQVNFVGLLDSCLEQQNSLKISKLFRLSPIQLLERIKNKINDRAIADKYGTDFWPHFYTSAPDRACSKGYQPKKYNAQVTLFQGIQCDKSLFSSPQPEIAWRKLLGDNLEVQAVSGSHLDICIEPHVQILAKKLIACMDKAINKG